jgi:hypothetical protein
MRDCWEQCRYLRKSDESPVPWLDAEPTEHGEYLRARPLVFHSVFAILKGNVDRELVQVRELEPKILYDNHEWQGRS